MRPADRPAQDWLLVLARIAALVALAVCVYLAWVALQGSKIAGCGETGPVDCESVLQSQWSRWFSLPVSIPAAGVYALLLVALLFVGGATSPIASLAWKGAIALSLMAAGAAIWFITLQFFWLQSLCTYCLVVHGCGLLIAGLICTRLVAAAGHGRLPIAPKAFALSAAIGLLCLSGLLAGQFLSSEPGMEIVGDDSPAPAMSVPPVAKQETEDKTPSDSADSAVASSNKMFKSDASDALASETSTAPSEHTALKPTEIPDSASSNTTTTDQSNTTDQSLEELFAEIEASQKQSDSPEQVVPAEATNSSTARATATSRRLALRGGQTVDAYAFPIDGSPQADYVIVKLFDYTCSHCRIMHQYLHMARLRYGDRLAILLVPVPLNTRCNKHVTSDNVKHAEACELAALALQVWAANPTKFAQFHEWLFEPNTARTAHTARRKAIQLVGVGAIDQPNQRSAIDEQIAEGSRLYGQLGKGVIPKLLYQNQMSTGKPNSERQLFQFIEQKIGLKPIAP
jgi:uncharacterized membrane protein/protein-disulfide isomerase